MIGPGATPDPAAAPREDAHRAAVLGRPIAHSLSPALHREAYRRLGLPWRYDAVDVGEQELPAFITGCDESWVGLSLTMPLKTAALQHCDVVTPVAADVGAVNTITFRRDGAVEGGNTDVPGLVGALRERGLVATPSTATVLGGGATARSALAALARVGAAQVACYLRRPAAGDDLRRLSERLGMACVIEPWSRAAEGLLADVVVATTPAGSTDDLAVDVANGPGLLLDVVYAPWPTALARAWQERRGRVASGLDLLVHQAALQVARWSGSTPSVAELRAAGEDALHPR